MTPILRNATLRTVASQPGVTTIGSLDVELEVGLDDEIKLRSAEPGKPTEITATVDGGTQLTSAGNVQAQRSYPELECNGESYGPVIIVKPAGGIGGAPVLQVGQVITLRVG